MTEKTSRHCELCSLPVEVDAFTEMSKDDQLLFFCCEGCKNIYRLLHSDRLKTQQEDSEKH